MTFRNTTDRCLPNTFNFTFMSVPNNLQNLSVYILLLVNRNNDEKVTDVVFKYFMDHASQRRQPLRKQLLKAYFRDSLSQGDSLKENSCLSIFSRFLLRFPLVP